MFLTKRHIFAYEFVNKTKMAIANISMAREEAESKGSFETIKKYGRYSFIDTKSHLLPAYIKQHLKNHTFQSMECFLPLPWVKKHFNCTQEDLYALYVSRPGEIVGQKKIAGLEFVEFNKNFVQKMSTSVSYVLNNKELDEVIRYNHINGYFKINKNSYFTWY